MNEKQRNCYKYYCTGCFLAETMLSGVYNNDLQMANMGLTNRHQIVFIDSGNMSTITDEDIEEIFDGLDEGAFSIMGSDESFRVLSKRIEAKEHYRTFKIPEELTEPLIEKFSRALASVLFDNASKPINLSLASYFRAGFVSRGGWLGHIVFSNLANKIFSSFSYTGKRDIPNYILPDTPSKGNFAFSIAEWKRVFAQTPEAAKHGFPVSKLSRINRHYWNIFEITRHYIAREMIGDIQGQNELIPLLADQCYRIGLFNAAYGLSRKYCFLNLPNSRGKLLASDIQRSIKDQHFLALDDMTLAEDYVKNYPALFDIWWILYDLDTLNGQVKPFVNKNEF